VYDPCGKQGEPKLEAERIKYWIGQGAQVSPRVASILQKAGVVKGDEKAVAKALKELSQKKAAMRKPKKEEEKKEEGGKGEAPAEDNEKEAKPTEEAKPAKEEEPKAEAKDEKKEEPKPAPVEEKKSEPKDKTESKKSEENSEKDKKPKEDEKK